MHKSLHQGVELSGSPMSFKERLDTVVTGGIPDRVPCVPLIYYFAASYAKIPFQEFATSMRAFRKGIDLAYWEVGPWDAMYPLPITMDAPDYHIVWGGGVGMKPAFPEGEGDESQIFQFAEAEALMREYDYRTIMNYPLVEIGHPYRRFLTLLAARASGKDDSLGFLFFYLLPRIIRFGIKWVGEVCRWRLRGVPFLIGFSLEAPFDTFSMARGIKDFSRDLYSRPEELEGAAMRLAKSYVFIAREVCSLQGIKRFLLLTHRSSNDFISPDHYRRFVHPGIKLLADELSRRGIIMGLHCDGNWDLNFEHMTDLPENTIFQLDGFSDIFRARQILGNKYTLMGDVPSNMLALGTASEVEEYCIRLINEVGAEGHFILSSGCEVPANAKPENVHTMLVTAKRHGRYQ